MDHTIEQLQKEAVSPAKEPCRVLLVEDDIDDRMMEKRELEALDGVAEVVCFANGDELLEYMRERGFQDRSVMCFKPTAIVTDLYMPKMNGFELLEQIKGDGFLENMPVILISSALSPQNAARAQALKADALLKKPFKAQKISDVLGKAWSWPPSEMW
jgi:CheY-like chemotaxis protein